jgi:hypothetical protein
MNARQERQINGYPLRSFSANAPAIILPDKYGGLPMYTRNQTEYSDFVSRYTAPLSTALQNDTVLLGRQGYSVTNESASQPFQDVGFEHNLHKSKDAIDYNEAAIKQRQWLQYQSQVARKQKQGAKVTAMRMSSDNSRGIKHASDGIFIGADGAPMTQINNDSLGQMAYEASIRTKAPTQNFVLPGPGEQEDPSTDDLVEYNPFIDGSKAIADEIIGLSRSDQVRRLDFQDFKTLKGGFTAYRDAKDSRRRIQTPTVSSLKQQAIAGGGLIRYSPNTVEGTASSRVLNTARRTLFPSSPGVSNQEIVIDSNPLSSQASVLSSPSYIPGGSQALSLAESMLATTSRARLISSQGGISTPDRLLISSATRPPRNTRRESMFVPGTSNRPNEILGHAIREAAINRARKRAGGFMKYASAFVEQRVAPFKSKQEKRKERSF